MKYSLIISLCCLFLPPAVFSQFNKKKFKDGYVLINADSFPCKIFWGSSVDEFEQVVFKYKDRDEPTSTFAGGPVKGYGVKVDSVEKKFFAITAGKHNRVYGEVLAEGFMTLLTHHYLASQPAGSPNGIYMGGSRKMTDYYLYKRASDSSVVVSKHPFIGTMKIDDEKLKSLFADYPDLAGRIPEKIKIDELIQFVREYNTYKDKKRNPVTN